MHEVASEIVTAIAAAEGGDPGDLDYALQDYVDVDAIEALLTRSDGSWTLSFEVPGHSVTVTDDGVVLVDGESPDRVVPA